MTVARVVDPALAAINRATTSLLGMQPFFALVLLHLELVEDKTCGTMWTDGKRLGYDPNTVANKWTHDELMGVLAHEVCHVVGLHPYRLGDRDHENWNIATDACINGIVLDSELVLPSGVVAPIRDQFPEQVYETLPKPKGGGQDKSGDKPSKGGGKPSGGGGIGEVRQPVDAAGQPLSKQEMSQREQETKFIAQIAMNAAQEAGKLPAGLARAVEEAIEPRVPWREILARFMDARSKNDYSWMRPNRRYGGGIILPSLYSEDFGKVGLGCDTSGSIDREMLKEVCGEALGCLALYAQRGEPPELDVVWFDVNYYAQVVSEPEDLRPQGGGGTSYAKMFAFMATLDIRAAIIVTDGRCHDFGVEPPMPVLWILTEPYRGFKPPFGEVAWIMDQ